MCLRGKSISKELESTCWWALSQDVNLTNILYIFVELMDEKEYTKVLWGGGEYKGAQQR